MLADDFQGYDGWLVDHVRVRYPGGALDVPPAPTALRVGRPWPNPARGVLGLSVALPRAAAAEWALYDVAGRRVATLLRGGLAPGERALRADLPPLPGGVYFSRLALEGVGASTARIAILP
jgi:hypothetical protein